MIPRLNRETERPERPNRTAGANKTEVSSCFMLPCILDTSRRLSGIRFYTEYFNNARILSRLWPLPTCGGEAAERRAVARRVRARRYVARVRRLACRLASDRTYDSSSHRRVTLRTAIDFVTMTIALSSYRRVLRGSSAHRNDKPDPTRVAHGPCVATRHKRPAGPGPCFRLPESSSACFPLALHAPSPRGISQTLPGTAVELLPLPRRSACTTTYRVWTVAWGLNDDVVAQCGWHGGRG